MRQFQYRQMGCTQETLTLLDTESLLPNAAQRRGPQTFLYMKDHPYGPDLHPIARFLLPTCRPQALSSCEASLTSDQAPNHRYGHESCICQQITHQQICNQTTHVLRHQSALMLPRTRRHVSSIPLHAGPGVPKLSSTLPGTGHQNVHSHVELQAPRLSLAGETLSQKACPWRGPFVSRYSEQMRKRHWSKESLSGN